MNKTLSAMIALFLFGCQSNDIINIKKEFKNPPKEYRPVPFWHINGHLTTQGIKDQIIKADTLNGFGGVTVLPISAGGQYKTGIPCPGTEPQYLSKEYFDRYQDILSVSDSIGSEVILYDDIDFPSGSAGGRLQKEFPDYTRKHLVKEEIYVKGDRENHINLPNIDHVKWMVTSAMDTISNEIVSLTNLISDSTIIWDTPKGDWRVMFFGYEQNSGKTHNYLVDYMDTVAVNKLIEMTYDEYGKRYNKYFGNVITKSFFDDVGFVHDEETWTPEITSIFQKKYNRDPALYYPALYYDIGEETLAARVAFFDIRSELMAEGYVRKVSEWAWRNNLMSMGHPPENYSPNSVVANGDILKYYRHIQIPLLDAIFSYDRGKHGFKQICSAADRDDKPIVGGELCGAFNYDMDSLTLYRVAMDAFARGVNFVVPHGMWYDTDSNKVKIPPLIWNENPRLRESLPNYSSFVGRSCMLLQGGLRIVDIAVLWPINAIEAESYINRDKNSGLPVANWLPEGVNHLKISDILTNEIREDFTYIHPEDLSNGKISIDGNNLRLNNNVNVQNYKLLILPGGEVISADALKKVCEYLKNGGKVISVGALPRKSSEFDRDKEIAELMNEINNQYLGKNFIYLNNAESNSLEEAINNLGICQDVIFNKDKIPSSSVGFLNYLHKANFGKEIYYFSNTQDCNISTQIFLKGKYKNLEWWNPHKGNITKIRKTDETDINGEKYTQLDLNLQKVSSIFIVGDKVTE
ncbi:MAG: glycosyl hydrolase [Bacteroidales bacterium]|nr:glycosyl hydrolase [Bacteroidales bacterium]